ncbi:MAG: hypothetical protein M3Z50_08555 [Actinomycetota bacterium]|nr:hypothetical protein [Actinomycetota bacterium]
MSESQSTYDVVLLIEQALSQQDVRQVRSLHEEIEGRVRYHVLLPVEDAAGRIEAGIGSLGSGEVMAAPAVTMGSEQVEEMQKELLEGCRSDVAATVSQLKGAGAEATGTTVTEDPIEALAATVKDLGAGEAIILTRSHVVAEFFHLDWTSRARRKLGVPVLHLLEHENFDEQAGGTGEGVTGL